jgi:hypothetical protein
MQRFLVPVLIAAAFVFGVGTGVFVQFVHDAGVITEAYRNQTVAEQNAARLKAIVDNGPLKATVREIKLPAPPKGLQ